MQNKKQKEKQKADDHLNRLAEIKAKRRNEPSLERTAAKKDVYPRYLIYCEGKNTEPSYFNQFKLSTLTVEAFGEGKNTLSLVKEAKKIAEKAKKEGKEFKKVWCVFDADPKRDNPKQLQNFNNAITLAKSLGFEVAYSNQAFEYWLLLHFNDHQGAAMYRTLYGTHLNTYLSEFNIYYDYNNSKIIDSHFFNILMMIALEHKNGKTFTRTDIAIKRAEKVYARLDHLNPGKEESSTTVFKLVKQLLKFQ